MTLDDLRTLHGELGFAVYALEPGAVVTLEIHTPDGRVYSFEAISEAAAIAIAFPPTVVQPTAIASDDSVFD